MMTWILAGSPPHYATALGVIAYAILEWFLPRTKLVAGNSVLEALANGAKRALLHKVPLLGKLITMLATPTSGLPIDEVPTDPGKPPVRRQSGKADPLILIMILCAFGLAAVAFAGCAGGQDGLKQACTNVDNTLVGLYQLDTATMKQVIASGKAHQLQLDFEVATAGLDAAAATKNVACVSTAANNAGWAALALKVVQAGADASAAIAKLVAAVKGAQ